MTLSELQALPDSELNDMAARLVMGWTLVVKMGTYSHWADSDGNRVCDGYKWRPTTDRNQSGECLQRMVTRPAVVFAIWRSKKMAEIDVSIKFGHSVNVPGNDARAEVIAALLAHFAMEEK